MHTKNSSIEVPKGKLVEDMSCIILRKALPATFRPVFRANIIIREDLEKISRDF